MRERRALARRLCRLAMVAVAALPACARGQIGAAAPAPVPDSLHADTAALRARLDSLIAHFHGTVGYSITNLDTQEHLELRGDTTFPTASLIKVPILVTLYDLVGKGMISLDDPLTVLKIDQVPGSGDLQYFHDGDVITVHDAAWLMATISDNTAANLLLNRIIIRRVWNKMEALGLPHTKVHSKTFLRISSVAMDSSVKYGLGVSTPNEMARLFILLAHGQAVGPAADSAILFILQHNTDNTLLERYLDGVRVARKTGAVDDARSECSLMELRTRVVVCVFTKDNQDKRWILDSEPQLLMAHMGAVIARAWGVGDSASVDWP